MDFVVFIISIAAWAAVDYYVAKILKEKNEGFKVEPALYAGGAILFGGLWPLLFLICKFLVWKNKNR